MTAFSTVTPTPAPLDPYKHVNYALGMVLGVDDFRQEFAYHAARDKWLARDMIGAGTVRGLDVNLQPAATGTAIELVVQPGVGLTPHGQIVRVPSAQCAVLDDWVANNQTAVATSLAGSPPGSPPGPGNVVVVGSPPESPGRGTITLYTILRYKHCLTDQVPIPGEPCRSASDAMAASRVTDGFELDLSLTPPAPTEDPGMTEVLGWLAKVPLVAGAGSASSAIVVAMRTAFGVATATPGVPLGPPAAPTGVSIGAANAPAVYRAALQYYATRLRDLLAGSLTADAVPHETGILLATLYLPVAQNLSGQWTLDPNAPPQVDTTRPFLVPLEMLQDAWIASLASTARYRLVTAGLFSVQATAPTAAAAATGLQAWWGTAPEINVSFPDSPVSGTQYIVKAFPFVATSPAGAPPQVSLVVTSITTNPPGCTIAAIGTGAPTHIAGLSLLLEINALVGS